MYDLFYVNDLMIFIFFLFIVFIFNDFRRIYEYYAYAGVHVSFQIRGTIPAKCEESEGSLFYFVFLFFMLTAKENP